MGRSVAVVGLSVTNGHDGYPPVHVVTGSDYASCNGRPIALVGSKCEGHNRSKGTYHVPIVSSGSSFFKVNGISVAVVGSEVADGGCDSDHVIVTGDDFADIDI